MYRERCVYMLSYSIGQCMMLSLSLYIYIYIYIYDYAIVCVPFSQLCETDADPLSPLKNGSSPQSISEGGGRWQKGTSRSMI